jgi:hypothetical protein
MQQAATAMLAQANQMPNVVLSLLKWFNYLTVIIEIFLRRSNHAYRNQYQPGFVVRPK